MVHGSGGLTSLWLFQRMERSRERGEDPGGLSLSVTLENYEARPLPLTGGREGKLTEYDYIRAAAAQSYPLSMLN